MADTLLPPLQQLTDTNRGPLVVVATYIFLATSCLAVLTKLWTRIAATSRLVWTDGTILAAWLCFVGQAISLTVAVNHGIGRHIEDLTAAQIEVAGKALYASNILLPIVLGGAKASISLLILSVQPFPGPAKTACHIFLGVVAAWTFASIFAVAFQCDLPRTWQIIALEHCANQHAIEIGLGVINILTDFAIVVLAFFLIKTVQISLQRKCVIIFLFSLRLATPPFAILALLTSEAFYSTEHPDRTWNAVPPLIYTQVMIGVSIITACIPSVKRFFDMVHSGVSNVPVSTAEQYQQYELSTGRSGSVTTLGKKFRARFGSVAGKSRSRMHSDGVVDFSNSGSRYSVHVEGGRGRDTDSVKRLAGSVEGINTQTEYVVEFEDNNAEIERGIT